MLAPVHSTHLLAKLGIRHGFFTRQGGASVGVYGSLNCGYGSGDMRDIVHANRAAVAGYMGVPHAPQSHLLTAHQVHSATAILVETPWAPDRQPKADAMVTRTPGIALGALAADCTPVLFADAEARVVGAAHAGWRGALGGVLEATLDLMVRAGARRDHIVAAVGPCIGPAAYEVGPEFEAEFIEAYLKGIRYKIGPDEQAGAKLFLEKLKQSL